MNAWPAMLLPNVSCVAVGGRGVLILGEPGSGKSSLALALIDRGAVLIGDDGVSLTRDAERLIARPPPNIAGLIEVRNVGLVRLHTAPAPLNTAPLNTGPLHIGPLAIALRLTGAAPRLPDAAGVLDLLGLHLPLIELWPASPALPLRAEYALAMYGLA